MIKFCSSKFAAHYTKNETKHEKYYHLGSVTVLSGRNLPRGYTNLLPSSSE